MYVLDTDVSIDYMRGNQKVVEFLDSLVDVRLTTITAAELFFGANSIDKIKITNSLKDFLQKFNMLPFQLWDAIMFGKIKADLKRKGTPIEDMDVMIAAIALSYGFTVITRNLKHFQKIKDLKLITI